MKYLIAVLIFGIIIMVHEMGHFITAKLCGIKVNQFALGMGPRLIKKQWGETEYSIRLFPLGGFCAMEGEDTDSENSRAFGNKKVWQKMIVVAAGAVMNIILGLVLAVILTSMDAKVPTTAIESFHTVSEKSEVYSAESYDSGLREGDKIVRIDNIGILTIKDLQYALLSTDSDSYDLVVKRNGEKIFLENVFFKDKTTGSLIDFYLKWEDKNPINVISYSVKDTISTAKLVWLSLKDLVTGKYGFKDLSGPVGLVSAIGDAADSGDNFKESLMSILSLAELITINLGIFNLLPIPGLDGGRLFFLIIEAVRGKPVKPEHEGAVHLIGMALLLFMILVVTFGDIKRLIG
ncbi:MAG: RIP metalloprotease RseP [Clostridium sp.]|nr:RIP metalloprotease RseP [Clostridium sp.]MCM1547119.1 RIP metalloprotease RseP [Ruminococcus sp.]